MVRFLFCVRDGYENFEKLKLNVSKCNPSLPLPFEAAESSKHSQCIIQSSVNNSHHYF